MDKIKILRNLNTPLLKSLSTDEIKLYLLFLVYPELDLKTIKRTMGDNYDLKQLRASLQKLENLGLGKMDIIRSSSQNRGIRIFFKLDSSLRSE